MILLVIHSGETYNKSSSSHVIACCCRNRNKQKKYTFSGCQFFIPISHIWAGAHSVYFFQFPKNKYSTLLHTRRVRWYYFSRNESPNISCLSNMNFHLSDFIFILTPSSRNRSFLDSCSRAKQHTVGSSKSLSFLGYEMWEQIDFSKVERNTQQTVARVKLISTPPNRNEWNRASSEHKKMP